jgi:hypothetical protein
MTRPDIKLWLTALCLSSLGFGGEYLDGEPSTQMVWVTKRGQAALRLPRELMDAEVRKAAALLVPDDHRFTLQRAVTRLLPHRNVIEFESVGLVSVPFVAPKTVTITVSIKPRIDGKSVRLTYAGMRRDVSRCEPTGPLCFMIKRAIDRHVGDGSDIQQFLDEGVNATLRPLFRAASEIPCERGSVQPRRIATGDDFIEIVLTKKRADVSCLRNADFFPSGFRADTESDSPSEMRKN